MWIHQYCTSNGFKMTPDAQEYVAHLIDLWQDVPVSFMRTEFDRYFLQITVRIKSLQKSFSKKMVVIMGVKNIFTLKEALLNEILIHY